MNLKRWENINENFDELILNDEWLNTDEHDLYCGHLPCSLLCVVIVLISIKSDIRAAVNHY